MKKSSQVRLENLTLVIDKFYDGVARRMALDYEVQQTQISRYYSKTQSKRGISDSFARAIEVKHGLGDGWMDTDHSASQVSVDRSDLDLLVVWRQLSPEFKAGMMAQMKALAEKN